MVVCPSFRLDMFSRIIVPALCASLILNLADSQYATDVCPPNLTRDHYLQVRGDSCYQFVVYRTSTHSDAKAECERNGGGLVLIKDQDTQNYLQHQLHNTYHVTHSQVWTGLSDIANENDFVWDDGTRPVYADWSHGGNPGPSGNHEANDCVVMDMAAGGKWRVFYCDVHPFMSVQHQAEVHGFICEYPIHASTTEAIKVTTTVATSQAPTTTTATSKMTTSTVTSQAPTTTTTTIATSKMTATPAPVGVVTSITHPCPLLMCSLDCGMHDFKKDPVTHCIICECDA